LNKEGKVVGANSYSGENIMDLRGELGCLQRCYFGGIF